MGGLHRLRLGGGVGCAHDRAPTGPLAATPLADRLGTTTLSLAVYFLAGRNMLWSVGAGVGALTLLTWGRTAPF